MKNKKGFTLTEVLAVVVILSILVLIVIGSVGSHIQEGKNRYNGELSGQLLAAGKTYFTDNTNLLPTSNYQRENLKTYNYVTATELASEGFLSKDFIDSDDRECNGSSFVYVDNKFTEEGIQVDNNYNWQACLICVGKDGSVKSYNDNPICDGIDWRENIIPRCEIDDDMVVGSGNPVIDGSVDKVIFTKINDETGGELEKITVSGIKSLTDSDSILNKKKLSEILKTELASNHPSISKYGTWKVELGNYLNSTGECGGIDIGEDYWCSMTPQSGGINKVTSAEITGEGASEAKYIYYKDLEAEDVVDTDNTEPDVVETDPADDPNDGEGVAGETEAGFNDPDDIDTTVQETNPGDDIYISYSLGDKTLTEALNDLLEDLRKSGKNTEYEILVGADDNYKASCGTVKIDSIAPQCSVTFIEQTTSTKVSGVLYYQHKAKVEVTNTDENTNPEQVKRCAYYQVATNTCVPTTTFGAGSNGKYIGTTLSYSSTKVYQVNLLDNAGNSGKCSAKMPAVKVGTARCKFNTDPKENEWLKGGQSRTLTAVCYQPKNFKKRSKNSSYIVGNNTNHHYSKLTRSVGSLNTSTRERKISVKFTAKKYSQKKIEGKERIRIKESYIYYTSNGKVTSKSKNAYSSYIKVDNKGPKIKYKTNKKKKSGGWYKTSSSSPFKVTISCSDGGSGMKSMSINGTSYDSFKKSFSRSKAAHPVKYKVVCKDKLGNTSKKTYKFNLKVYGKAKSCGTYCCKSYSYYTYSWYTYKTCYTTSACSYARCPAQCTASNYAKRSSSPCSPGGRGGKEATALKCKRTSHSGCSSHCNKSCWHY